MLLSVHFSQITCQPAFKSQGDSRQTHLALALLPSVTAAFHELNVLLNVMIAALPILVYLTRFTIVSKQGNLGLSSAGCSLGCIPSFDSGQCLIFT